MAITDEEVPFVIRKPTVAPVKVLPPKASKLWPEWRKAIQEELASLNQHQTWRLDTRSQVGKAKLITCRSVFAIKRDEHGAIKRYKARLVIHGHKQEYGVNLHETYTPVIRFETIRAAIYYGVLRSWLVMQFDVKTAFLYGPLRETIYMARRMGDDGEVYHLLKSLYGLRQAPLIWNPTLHTKLTKLGFERIEKDRGLYARKVGGVITILITVYVDDLLLIGPAEFGYLLGIEISTDREVKRVTYSQEQYIKEMLLKYHMASCRGAKTPDPSGTLQVRAPAEDDAPLSYRELVGALGYLVSGTRPDIAHAVRHLGKYLANFDVTHYELARYVLRYLTATADYKLVKDVREGKAVPLLLYTDADYANDPDDRKSISGYVTMIDGNVISYASRKQGLNAQSTPEAAYVAMAESIKDLRWVRQLCDELQ
ncbi:Integrase, catalytic core protein [Phytophthora megakarya]|uniref:Integrase, catalytic core protein n=1 Tax=Phytophthora megakarya TaxID=4795 RepID=A0A225W9P0_9STRA|nr:Integrase, catalytic core protein [Phytophthora megakarya]